MSGTYAFRLALSALGFALGLGVALAIRYEAPPDLRQPVCPDCRSGQYASPVTPPHPAGPRWHCSRCQGQWGPPDFRRPGYRR
jgi:hypothetical protein